MNSNIGFINDLSWRGMVQDITPNIEELFSNKPVSAYIGFDATADSLHVGHLMQIITLVHFQNAGHKPYVLVGGATSRVGDPSGKSHERALLDIQTLDYYQTCIQKQLEKFMSFSPEFSNRAEIVNNYEWFKNFNFLDFIRDIGKHMTVNYMMSKDSVKNRFAADSGISFTEFCYQLVQGYDFYHLATNKNCFLQMGGSDQWGNITTGIELIRRRSQTKAYGLTTKLIKKSDGTKFGKTESGAVWLDSSKTSPYKFYQFWFNAPDQDASQWLKYFSLRPKADIESTIIEHYRTPHKRVLQKALALELTQIVHSKQEAESAVKISEFLFSDKTVECINTLRDTQIQELFDAKSIKTLSKDILTKGLNIVDLLVAETQIISSRSEARRLISNRGVAINKSIVEGDDFLLGMQHVLRGKYIIIQKGKKNYFLVKLIS